CVPVQVINSTNDVYTDFSQQQAEESRDPRAEIQRRADAVIGDALPWITAQKDRFFAWVHLFDPHLPYDPPAPYDSRYAGRLYDGEIAYTDEAVGRLLAGLEAAGHGRDTLVIVTADHGESLGDHGERRHSFFIYDSTIRVPLIFWAPDLLPAAHVVRGQASVVSILPTTLALLGIDDPAADSRDGSDLRELIAHPDTAGTPAYSESLYPMFHFGWSELRALRAEGYKYVAAPRPELYDLRSDPQEAKNLVSVQPQLAATMRDELEALVGDDDPSGLGGGLSLIDPQSLDRLRRLGYLAGRKKPGAGQRVDPKDKVEIFESFQDGIEEVVATLRARDWEEATSLLIDLDHLVPDHFETYYQRGRLALLQGNAAAAVESLKRALSLSPAFTLTYVELARAYRAAHQPRKAENLLRQAMEAFPDTATFPMLLGSYDHQDGRLDEALEAYRVARSLAPHQPALLNNMAQLYLMRKEPREALPLMETLVEVTPDDAEAWSHLGLILGGLGEQERAETAFRQALLLQPDEASLHYGLGMVLLRQGQRQEATEAFKAALRVDPSFAAARAELDKLGGSGTGPRR
ncbi:MAG: tetratricopeptide repeat protein, partial [Acidobacteriota bacterium]